MKIRKRLVFEATLFKSASSRGLSAGCVALFVVCFSCLVLLSDKVAAQESTPASVEVEVDRSAADPVRVRRVCEAFECGKVINPDNLRAQVAGAIVMGLGPALREAVAFEGGKVTNASFWKYPVPRLADVPELDIHLLDRPDLPSVGAGETPLIAVAPAIANAVFHATGQRVRQMPLRLPPEPTAGR